MKGEIRPTNRWTLVRMEIFLISIISAVWICRKNHYNIFTGIIILVTSGLAIGFLFFAVRIFRYIFTIAFSVFWGLVIYQIAIELSKIEVASWVAAGITVLMCLVWHKDYFDFERR